MKNSRTRAALVSLAGIAVICGCLVAGIASRAMAGPEQNYGDMWAWDNDYKGTMGCSFGSGSTPNLTVSYDFGGGTLYGYPACIRGWHYGWNPTGDTKYPAQISKLGTDNAYFEFSCGGTNMYGDFAYDLFLRNDSQKADPELEVMIWGRNNSWPIGTKQRSNTVNGDDLWLGYNSGAGYNTFTFCPAGTGGGSAFGTTSGSIDVNLTTYLNYLTANYSSYVNSSWYLDVCEGGVEVTEGNGWDWVENSN